MAQNTKKAAQSKDEKQAKDQGDVKKASNMPLFVLVIAIIIIIASIFIINHYGQQDQRPPSAYNITEYNGFTFIEIDGMWWTQVHFPGKAAPHSLEMRYGPHDTEDISLQDSILDKITRSDLIYLTTAPDLSSKAVLAMIEIGRVTGEHFDIYNIPTKAALSYEKEGADPSVPIITCQNSTQDITVIDFRVGDQTSVYLQDYCIIIQGTDEEEIIRAADRVVYGLVGIMP